MRGFKYSLPLYLWKLAREVCPKHLSLQIICSYTSQFLVCFTQFYNVKHLQLKIDATRKKIPRDFILEKGNW